MYDKLTTKELAEKVGCSDTTIRTDICRAEFSKIEYIKKRQEYTFLNVPNKVINRLKELTNRKRGITG